MLSLVLIGPAVRPAIGKKQINISPGLATRNEILLSGSDSYALLFSFHLLKVKIIV